MHSSNLGPELGQGDIFVRVGVDDGENHGQIHVVVFHVPDHLVLRRFKLALVEIGLTVSQSIIEAFLNDVIKVHRIINMGDVVCRVISSNVAWSSRGDCIAAEFLP